MGSCCSSSENPKWRPQNVAPIGKSTNRELEILEQNARNNTQRIIQARSVHNLTAQTHSQTKAQNDAKSREPPKQQNAFLAAKAQSVRTSQQPARLVGSNVSSTNARTSQQPVKLAGSYTSSTSSSTDYTNSGYDYGYGYPTYTTYDDNHHHHNSQPCHDHHNQSHCHDNHTQSHCHDSHSHSNHDCHSSSLY